MSSSSREDDLHSCISDAVAENRAATLIESLRILERNAHRRDFDETGGGREDDSNSDSDDERASTYIDSTNYVAFTDGVNHHEPSSNGGIYQPSREQSLERETLPNH